jgi:hypothetical protein
MTDLEAAWAELDAANTMGWTVGRPFLNDHVRGAEHRQQWAYDGPKSRQLASAPVIGMTTGPTFMPSEGTRAHISRP